MDTIQEKQTLYQSYINEYQKDYQLIKEWTKLDYPKMIEYWNQKIDDLFRYSNDDYLKINRTVTLLQDEK